MGKSKVSHFYGPRSKPIYTLCSTGHNLTVC